MWAYRYTMSPDGIAYLDLSDSYLRGDWGGAVNGYWSPLFPMVIALVRRIIGSGPAHDFLAARIALLIAYIAGLLGIERLVRAILDARESVTGAALEPRERVIWWALGYALFVWASVPLMPEELVTPDRFVNAALFFASAAAVRMAAGRASVATAAWMGIALGLGYLAKAVMFPVAILMLLTTAVVVKWRGSARMRNVLVASIVFALVAAPQVAAVSARVGRVTFGEVGRLGFAWYIDRVPCPLWATDQECMGSPNGAARATVLPPQPFPSRTTEPRVFTFTDHARGTFPAWYDASVWYRKIRLSFPLPRMLVTFALNMGSYWPFILPFAIALIASVAALTVAQRSRWRDVIGGIAIDPVLVVPAVGALTAYALVYTESRYVSAFLVIAVMGVAARARSWVAAALLPAALMVLIGSAAHTARDAWWRRGEGATHFDEARALAAAGVTPGERVGIIGSAYAAPWARLARVQVIAEVHESEAPMFWCGTPDERARVLDAFRAAGARAVVATRLDRCADLSGWRRIGPAAYMRPLEPTDSTAASAPR